MTFSLCIRFSLTVNWFIFFALHFCYLCEQVLTVCISDPDSGSISPASHSTSGAPSGGAHVSRRAYLAQVLPKQRNAIVL